MSKLTIQLKRDKFDDFLTKLEDLSKISDTIKLKIDSENILMYSIVGETILLAFKKAANCALLVSYLLILNALNVT